MCLIENLCKREEINIILGDYFVRKYGMLSRKELARVFFIEFSKEQKEYIKDRNSFSNIAQKYLDLAVGTKSKLLFKLRDLYSEYDHKKNRDSVESTVYENIIVSENVSSIISFDYDFYFEKAHSEILNKVSRENPELSRDKINLYKVFGDFSNLDSLMVTTQDIKKYKILECYKSYFNSLCHELYKRKTVILGTDLQNPDICDMLEYIFSICDKSQLKEIYYFSTDKEKDAVNLEFLENYNIKILSHDKDNFQENTLSQKSIPKLFEENQDENNIEDVLESEKNEKLENNIKIENETEVEKNKYIQTTFFLNSKKIENSESLANSENSVKEIELPIMSVSEEPLKITIEEVVPEIEILKEDEITESAAIVLEETEETHETEEIEEVKETEVKEILQEMSNQNEVVSEVVEEVQQQIISEEPLQEILQEAEVLYLETAAQLKLNSLALVSNPVKYSNIYLESKESSILKLNVESLKVGQENIFGAKIRVLEYKNFKLIEIKNREFILKFGVDIFKNGLIVPNGEYLEYEIFENLNLNRFTSVLKLLKDIFSGDEISFKSSDFTSNISLKNEKESFKFELISEFLKNYEKISCIKEKRFNYVNEDYYKLYLLANLERGDSFETWGNFTLKYDDHNKIKLPVQYIREHKFNLKGLENTTVRETITISDNLENYQLLNDFKIYRHKKLTVNLEKI